MDLQASMQSIEPLNPVAISLGPFNIHWYGIIIGTAVLVGLYLAIREGKKHGYDADLFLDLALYLVPAAIIGARTYYVIFQWDYYSQHPEKIIAVWEGGLAIHGALIGSILTGFIYTRVKKLSFWKLADIIAPSLILGQAIGRWGNFMNQEAHGGVVSREFLESLHLPEFIINQMYIYNPFPGGDLAAGYYYHHPTFLYESLWNLAGFLLLILLRRVNLRRGELFLTYFIWYSVGRFFIEGLRTDSLMLTDTLRMAQVISIVLIVLALLTMFYRRKAGLADQRYWE